MTRRMPKLRQSRGLLLLGICLLVLGLLPAHSTQAAFANLTIDNTLADFTRGTFQRSSLGVVRVPAIPSQKINDLAGAVQLGPIGLLRNWKKVPSFLPSKLFSIGTAAIGTNIFVIGGIESSTYHDTVYSAPVNITNGILPTTWQTEPPLIKVRGSDDLPAAPDVNSTKSEIASPAVAAVNKPGGGGYIYVIGGEISQNIRKFSSHSVQRATVGADGHIVKIGNPSLNVGWTELTNANIPSSDPTNPFIKQRGVSGASAVVFTTPNGRTFIYLVGGLEEYLSAGAVTTTPTRRVWYTEVNVSTGALSNPTSSSAASAWQRLADIPLPAAPSSDGLWNTTAVADHFLTAVNGTNDALFVIGGQNNSTTFSAVAYRALINPTSGALTWTPKAGTSNYYTLPESRSGHGAAIFRGNIYLTSGQSSNSVKPDTSVLTSYVEDNLDLHNFSTGAGSNFLESTTALNFTVGPGSPRTTHGTILVQAGPTAPNTAFLYIIGGRGATGDPDTDDDGGSDSIEMAKIGGDEDLAANGYAETGMYYSAVSPIVLNKAQLQEISWATLITRTDSLAQDDIAIDYRVSNDADCTRPTWNDTTSWHPIDGSPDSHRSINGQNTALLGTSEEAHCFQYRAEMTSSANLKATPSLLNLTIRVFLPGGPDLKVQTLKRLGTDAALSGLSVVIENNNLIDPPTLAADTESTGSFYVDLCISGPGGAAPPKPTLPLSNSNTWSCDKAYANVEKSDLGPNKSVTILQWLNPSNDQPVDILSFFTTPGVYTVMVAVDSFDFVNEGTTGGENNNVSNPLTFQVDSVKPGGAANTGIYLPIIHR